MLQTRDLKNSIKKLHTNQKKDLDVAVGEIVKNPMLGEQKTGKLSRVMVYKFLMVGQLTLLAYYVNSNLSAIEFIDLGPHENFYRDLKN